MYGSECLKHHGLVDFPIAYAVHLSLRCEVEQNARVILAFACFAEFTGPLMWPCQVAFHRTVQSHPFCTHLYSSIH